MKKILFLIVIFFLNACSAHLTDFTMISNKNINLEQLNIDHLSQQKNVIGKDKVFIFLIIPFGYPTIKEALNDALQKSNGDLMLNATVSRKSWWFIVGQEWIEIKGDVVNTKKGDTNEF